MIFKILLELIKDILLIDLILSFISTSFNNMMIKELKKQNNRIDKLKENIISKFKWKILISTQLF